jgi:hypothetical protein
MDEVRSMFIVAAIAASAAACAPAAAPPGAAAETAASSRTAGIGGTARVGGVAITPLALLEDSRCPRDVTCVWAGRVRIRVRIEAQGSASEAEMEVGKPIAASRGEIVLAVVSPERTSSAAIEADDYRFTFDRAE